MWKRLLRTLAVVALAAQATLNADELQLRTDVPETYVVVKGDTLWDISSMYLESPWRWQELWHMNQHIKNPHLIYPGDLIGLVDVDGQLRLTTISRSPGADTVRMSPGDDGDMEERVMPDGTIRLRPAARYESVETAITTIPREHIEGFLHNNQILSNNRLERAAYVLSGQDGRLVLGEGDKIFARGDWTDSLAVYEIFRPGEVFTDPVTKEFLGVEAISLGRAELLKINDDIARFDLFESSANIRAGDRMLALAPADKSTHFYPSAPDTLIKGQIMSVARGVKGIGQYDVVSLNLGDLDGIEVGNVMSIFTDGGVVKDPIKEELVRLPNSKSGTLMVFRVFDRMSYALILEATDLIKVGDRVKSPQFGDNL